MKTRYKNPWFKTHRNGSGVDPEYYETDAKPVERDGRLVYNRIPGKPGRGCWDIVMNDICVAQYAGPNCSISERLKEPDYLEWLNEIGAMV